MNMRANVENITLHELNIVRRNDEKIRPTAPHEHTNIETTSRMLH